MMKPLLAEAERDQVPFLHSYDLNLRKPGEKSSPFYPGIAEKLAAVNNRSSHLFGKGGKLALLRVERLVQCIRPCHCFLYQDF